MKQKDIKNSLKGYFFTNPSSKMRVREIERVLKLPLPSVIRYCKELEKEGILGIIKVGSVSFYASNRVDERYLLEKKLFNIKQIYESGLIDYLRKELNNPALILFGSYSKGEDIESSDIDLYVETSLKKKLNLDKYSKLLKRDIQIFCYSSIQDIKNIRLSNNILNGLVLNGYIEVFK